MFDEPFGDTSAIPTYLVSKLARESVKVTLSGDGGDELFGGYKRYYNSKFNNLAYISNVFNKLGLNSILRSFSYKHGRNNGSYSDINFAFDLIRSENFNSFYFKSISHWKDLPILNSDCNPSSFDLHMNSFYSNDNLQKRTGIDFLSYLPDDILTKLDRTSMAVSLESRVPFLDHRLIEFAWNIPTSLKYKNNTPKWLLREILYNYVPKKMIDRPKMGFGVPINSWLKGPLKIWAECLIYDDVLSLNNFLDIKKIRLYWKMFLKGDNRLQHPLWLVLIYISWLKKN